MFDDARSMASGFAVGTATSTNVVDMKIPDADEAGAAEVVVQVIAGAGNGTIQVVLQDSADGSTGWSTILTGRVSVANGADFAPYRMYVPPKHRRYLRTQYVVATNNFTAGQLNAGVV
jgi:hypothetical protein